MLASIGQNSNNFNQQLDFSRPRKRPESPCPPPPPSTPRTRGLHVSSRDDQYFLAQYPSPVFLLPHWASKSSSNSTDNTLSQSSDTIITSNHEIPVHDEYERIKHKSQESCSGETVAEIDIFGTPLSTCSDSNPVVSEHIKDCKHQLGCQKPLLHHRNFSVDIQPSRRTDRPRRPSDIISPQHRIARKPFSPPQSPLPAEYVNPITYVRVSSHTTAAQDKSYAPSLASPTHTSDTFRSDRSLIDRHSSEASSAPSQPLLPYEKSGWESSDDEEDDLSGWRFGRSSTRSNPSQQASNGQRGRQSRRSLSETLRAFGHAFSCGS
ncbi:hypothetical protein MMC24_006524 [Lignoscripta atroalba]|nr:hypothetical protein [Lignoscripta atroalba]